MCADISPFATPGAILRELNNEEAALKHQHEVLARKLAFYRAAGPAGRQILQKVAVHLRPLAAGYDAVEAQVGRTRVLLAPFARFDMPTPPYMRAQADQAFALIRSQNRVAAKVSEVL